MLTRLRASGLLWPTVLTIPVLALLLSLGSWQLSRRAWKEALQAQIESRVARQPVALASLLKELPHQAIAGAGRNLDPTDSQGGSNNAAATEPLPAHLAYTRVSAKGVLVHELEQLVYAPHPRLGPGYHVYTPLRIGERLYVLVNRGYVPERLKLPSARAAGQIAGEVEVVGLVRGGGTKTVFDADRDARTGVWYWRDLNGMARAAIPSGQRALGFFIDAEAEPANPGGWPLGGTTTVKLFNRHLEYALTWFGLAATLVGVYVAFVWSRLARAATA